MSILIKILTVGVEFVHAHKQKMGSGDEELVAPHNYAKVSKRLQSIVNRSP
jgi:hypothetical protein